MVNVPLIQGNSIQEINTSIIAIKKAQKELETLNTQIDNKIKALNLALSGGSGKYIESISQTQGLIEVTEGSITDTVASGNNSPVTSNGVAEKLTNYYPKTLYTQQSSINIDNLTSDGFYLIRGAVVSNIPTDFYDYDNPGAMFGYVFVTHFGEYISQQITVYQDGVVNTTSRRRNAAGVWGKWIKYLTKNNFIFEKTITRVTSVNGNIDTQISFSDYEIISAVRLDAIDCICTVAVWNDISYGIHVTTSLANASAVINTGVTIRIKYIKK